MSNPNFTTPKPSKEGHAATLLAFWSGIMYDVVVRSFQVNISFLLPVCRGFLFRWAAKAVTYEYEHLKGELEEQDVRGNLLK